MSPGLSRVSRGPRFASGWAGAAFALCRLFTPARCPIGFLLAGWLAHIRVFLPGAGGVHSQPALSVTGCQA